VSVIVALDHLAHVSNFIGSQACRGDSWTAWLVIEITPSLGAAPTVVARCRETRDAQRCIERQDLPGARDRPKEAPLGFCFRKSLVIEPNLRYPKHGNQEANYGSEQSGSTPEPFDLDD
jgi:hypothetical protein